MADLRQHWVEWDIVGGMADIVAERMVVEVDERGRKGVEDEEGNLKLEGREPRLPAVVAVDSPSHLGPEVRQQSRIGCSYSETRKQNRIRSDTRTGQHKKHAREIRDTRLPCDRATRKIENSSKKKTISSR